MEAYGFVSNWYDLHIVNEDVNDTNLTMTWHVVNIKISHLETVVIDQKIECM